MPGQRPFEGTHEKSPLTKDRKDCIPQPQWKRIVTVDNRDNERDVRPGDETK
jgi:hypothetical protein